MVILSLGPTLTLGNAVRNAPNGVDWVGLLVFAIQTAIVFGLVWLTLRLLERDGEAFAVVILIALAFWVACILLPAALNAV